MGESAQEPRFTRGQRTRRNFMALGAVAASAFLSACKGERNLFLHTRHPPCFLKGTKILTVSGEQRVEDLKIGDSLPTVFGGIRPIQWIGNYRQRKSDPNEIWPKGEWPVRIVRSALAPGIPHTDMCVTKGHAVLVDGVLVPIGNLINGTLIRLYAAEEFEELEFFHIKLETHDVIYAEGAPWESLLTVDAVASNFAEYVRRCGIPKAQPPCAPILSYNGARSEIRSRIRSAMAPWFDCRQKLDVIRDRLEERVIVLAGQKL